MLKAIIDATGYKSSLDPLLAYRPTPLLCVCDKPILFHVIDFLSTFHITHYDILISHLPASIEEALGDGARWGISITYHLVRDPTHPFKRMKTLAKQWGDQNVLLACGDGMPCINIQQSPILWMYPHYRWSGWGILPASLIANIHDSATPKTIGNFLPSKVKIVYTNPVISTDSYYDLQRSNRSMLNGESLQLQFPFRARKGPQGIWISHGASIHSSVKIIPPVFVGQNCRIKSGCVVGPYGVIESECFIDKGSTVAHALIFKNSYVGEDLRIDRAIIDRNLLINLTYKTAVEVRDDFILCEMTVPSSFSWISTFFECSLAIFFLIFLSPFYLLMLLNHSLHHEQMLSLPAKKNPVQWRSFSLYSFKKRDGNREYLWQKHFIYLPALINIIRGELHFVGVAPRSPEAVSKLPTDWRYLYLSAKCGWINPSTENQTEDEIYTAEAYYAVKKGFWTDITLLWQRLMSL